MARAFRLRIVTPERVIFDEQVEMVIAPGTEGELAVQAYHTAFATSLKPGVLRVRKDIANTFERLSCTGGFLHVLNNDVQILADASEFANEIDVERALKARQRAEERLVSQQDIDVMRAKLALERALARLKTVGYEEDK